MNEHYFDLPADVEKIIPHRLPMRLVDRILEITDGIAIIEAQLSEGQLFIDGTGELDNIAYVEMIAQAYASMRGYRDRIEGLPIRDGFMVSVRKVKHYAAAFAGDMLKIHVSEVGEFDFFTVAEGKIYNKDQLLAQAQISLWIPETLEGKVNISGAMGQDL